MTFKSKGNAIAREYCLKHPDVNTLTLARMALKNEPAIWQTLTAAREAIRWARSERKHNKQKDPVARTAPRTTQSFCYTAPQSMATDYSDFVIHGAQRILRLSDIHYPFHDQRSLEAAVNHGIKLDPTILLLAGDIIDCHDLSDYDRDPRHRYTEIEMAMIVEQLEQFRQAFPKARIVWMEGNHEHRLKRYLMRRAPDLYGLPMMDVPGFVTIAGHANAMHRVEWVDDCRVVRTGKLAHIHGHEFKGGGGVNPARWLFLKTGESAMMGHCHRTSEHSEPNLSGKQIACWSTGCLSELHPPYMRHTKWNHGFATVIVDASGDFEVSNHRIINGKVL